MTLKRFISILLLLALVISVAACQPDTADEAVEVATDTGIAVAAEVPEVEKSSVLVAEAGREAAHDDDRDDAAHSAEVESEEAADHHDVEESEGEHAAADVPGFVPPKPATLEMGAEAAAFAFGDPEAAVKIVEFTDYQCPYCQRYALETMPAMVEHLVETGRVYYAVKDLPLDAIHPEARTASVAARCAGEQDAYLSMHDAIFEAQADWSGTGGGAEAIFADLAGSLDLDVDAYSTCVADGDQAAKVQANVEEALPWASLARTCSLSMATA